MELNFKDKKSARFFKEQHDNVSNKQQKENDMDFDITEDFFSASNPMKLENLELMHKVKVIKAAKLLIHDDEKTKEAQQDDKSAMVTAQLNRIEAKQRAMLEILECFPAPTVGKVKLNSTVSDEMNILKLNLELFGSKLIILSTESANTQINCFLCSLQNISEHLVSNSIIIFSSDKSPISLTLEQLNKIGVGDSQLNILLHDVELVLKNIDKFSKMDIFERSYNFANLMLQKGLVLNAITLLNETTGIYIIQSIKNLSKEIARHTVLENKEDSHKLHSRAKNFFISIFSEHRKSSTSSQLFQNNKSGKEIEEEIARKFKNIQNTWSHKGDVGIFQKYAYIVERVRVIRNSLAHGNTDISFRELTSEIQKLNDDFNYHAITKNLLKL
jgi:hypothetical protein